MVLRSPAFSSTIALKLIPKSADICTAAFVGLINLPKEVLSAFAPSDA